MDIREVISKPFTNEKIMFLVELIAANKWRFSRQIMDEFLKKEIDIRIHEDGATFYMPGESKHQLMGFVTYDSCYDYKSSRTIDRVIIVHNKGIMKIFFDGKITHKQILI